MDTTTFAPVNAAVLGPSGRRTVLDDAHVGDIRGALGTLRAPPWLPSLSIPARRFRPP